MSWEIRQGDALELLRAMPAASVQCCVTSPPYWGLRDYGTAQWEGGSAECDHRRATKVGAASTLRDDGREHAGPYEGEKAATFSVTPFREACGKCGARRIDRQLGLESTPEEYVARMVDVFREVRRVLRDDGTLWLNLGDSYCGAPPGNARPDHSGPKLLGTRDGQKISKTARAEAARDFGALKPKDLVGIPWRVAFALQADGWWLRSDIIWSKPNPMPEGVTDRPTKAHEYLFLLAKSERYCYDAAAVRETAAAMNEHDATGQGWQAPGQTRQTGSRAKGNSRTFRGGGAYTGGQSFHNSARVERESHGNVPNNTGTRNRRSVWTVTTQPFAEAHFAVMPERLVEPCILAGSRPGSLVLDPFAGSGTVGVVASRFGRSFLGLELNEDYCEMARRRLDAATAQGLLPLAGPSDEATA